MKIYIGYDSKQHDASRVCEYSLRKHCSTDLDIVHLKTDELKKQGIYFRTEGSPASTEFTYSRFLVPYLQNYKGWAMFVDSDFVFTHDINSLFRRVFYDLSSDTKSVYVCQHPMYTPKSDTKFYGKPQLTFPKKNWSSLMVFNCEHPHAKWLTPMSVSNQTPQWLHRFTWTTENSLGHIPTMWNWLVGEYEGGDPIPYGIHFTNGGPFNRVYGQDYEDIWVNYYSEMSSLQP